MAGEDPASLSPERAINERERARRSHGRDWADLFPCSDNDDLNSSPMRQEGSGLPRLTPRRRLLSPLPIAPDCSVLRC